MAAANGPFMIADSLHTFKHFIAFLYNIAKNRAKPADFENSPITETVQLLVLAQIEAQNIYTELWYWEIFIKID